LWRIRSARAASNCSDVKEEPHFQAGLWQTRKMMRPIGLTKGRHILNPPGELLPSWLCFGCYG
jgi:hypothetical protein